MRKDDQICAMVRRLRKLCTAHGGEGSRRGVARWIEDPLRPKTATGRTRINLILLLLAALTIMAAGTFLFFSEVAP